MKLNPTPENVPQLLEEIATDLSTTCEYAGILRFAAAQIQGLKADAALATDVLNKTNQWILEAKPLLEEGGEYRRKYLTLIMAVERKFEGESRHDTALRYIREREEHHEGPAQVATPP